MNAKQKLFAREYLVDRNATQAAVRAGYAPRAAGAQAHKLLKKAEIANFIAKHTAKRAEKLDITYERIIEELAKIAFGDVRRVVKWGDGLALQDPETGKIVVANGVAAIASDKIDDDTAAAISEIAQTPSGLKVKLHDKRAALESLVKHMGLSKARTPGDGPDNPLVVRFDSVDRDA